MPTKDSKPKTKAEQIADDPFDVKRLQLSQDFASRVGVKKLLNRVPCRKPRKQEFVRVRIGAEWQLETLVFEDELERETYLVAEEFMPDLLEQIRPVCLRVAINKQDDPFFWALKLPGADGRSNPWAESAIDAAKCAEKNWVRISASMSAGAYEVYQATGDLAEPTWPDVSLRDLLELSFKNRYINAEDHPAIKKMRGEV